jgi:hypothetical protein
MGLKALEASEAEEVTNYEQSNYRYSDRNYSNNPPMEFTRLAGNNLLRYL